MDKQVRQAKRKRNRTLSNGTAIGFKNGLTKNKKGLAMKQYCRYCVYLCVNNVPYCSAHEECVSKSSCKRPNNCKDFIFADVPPEYQDAFGETNGYVPHKPRQKECDGQIILDGLLFDCEQTDEELPFCEVK